MRLFFSLRFACDGFDASFAALPDVDCCFDDFYYADDCEQDNNDEFVVGLLVWCVCVFNVSHRSRPILIFHVVCRKWFRATQMLLIGCHSSTDEAIIFFNVFILYLSGEKKMISIETLQSLNKQSHVLITKHCFVFVDWLRERVRNIFSRFAELHIYCVVFYLLSCMMKTHVDVFGACAICIIFA